MSQAVWGCHDWCVSVDGADEAPRTVPRGQIQDTLTYPEPGLGGTQETGSVTCPGAPSASNPCSITIRVNAADVGGPTSKSQLEEVGGYAFAASHPQGATTNAQAEADNVPLEVDGLCCYNARARS